MKDEKKSETAKESKRQILMFFIFAWIVSTLAFGTTGWFWFKGYNENRGLKVALVGMTETIKGKDSKILTCDDELAKLKLRMEGIKNDEDLLKRDIFLYIDKKFQLIPRTLAADIALQIVGQAKMANVSPELIVGIIEVESSFNPMAVSSKNARGLMQVMPEWAKKFNLKKVSDLHDVDVNIISGIKVLKIHIDEEKGNISKGLYRYVGRSDSYSGKVYAAMGKFVAFRSTIDDDETDIGNGDKPEDEEKEEEKDIDRTEPGTTNTP